MATSATTFYELVLAKMRGEKIDTNLAVDPQGNITTEPAEAMKGGILPFDRSYKGSSLSMMVELLSGPLAGSSYCDNEDFLKNATDMIEIIRDKGASVPGDNGRKREQEIIDKDQISIEKPIAKLLGL